MAEGGRTGEKTEGEEIKHQHIVYVLMLDTSCSKDLNLCRKKCREEPQNPPVCPSLVSIFLAVTNEFTCNVCHKTCQNNWPYIVTTNRK